ncbi:hypothetical protein FKM82_022655 [Ascaphus truei]
MLRFLPQKTAANRGRHLLNPRLQNWGTDTAPNVARCYLFPFVTLINLVSISSPVLQPGDFAIKGDVQNDIHPAKDGPSGRGQNQLGRAPVHLTHAVMK